MVNLGLWIGVRCRVGEALYNAHPSPPIPASPAVVRIFRAYDKLKSKHLLILYLAF